MFRLRSTIINSAMALVALAAVLLFCDRSRIVIGLMGTGSAAGQVNWNAGLVSNHRNVEDRESSCKIDGVVLDKTANEPIAGAIVVLVAGTDSPLNISSFLSTLPSVAVTDLDGRWTATPIKSDSFIISAAVPPYLPQTMELVNPCNRPNSMAPKLLLSRGGVSIKGTVKGPASDSVTEALVLASSTYHDESGRAIEATFGALSAVDGRYWLQLEAGMYDFQAFHLGGLVSRKVSKTLGYRPNRVDLSVLPTASISGRVRTHDSDSKLGDIAVRLVDETGVNSVVKLVHPAAFLTNELGEFEIDQVRPGTIELSAGGRGLTSLNAVSINLAPGEKQTGVELWLERVYTISGNVVRAGAKTAEFLDVWAYAKDTRSGEVASGCRVGTQTGQFELGGLRPSTYVIELRSDPTTTCRATGRITVDDADVHIEPIVFEAGAKISGQISPPSDGTVSLTRLLDERSAANPASATSVRRTVSVGIGQGAFSFGGVESGDVVLVAEGKDGRHGEARVHVNGHDVLGIKIDMRQGASLSGRVLDDGSGQPAREAWVAVSRVGLAARVKNPVRAMGSSQMPMRPDDKLARGYTKQPPYVTQLVKAKADGSFEVKNLDEGDYLLSVYNGEGKLAKVRGSSARRDYGHPVTLSHDEEKSGLVLEVDPCLASITGIVVDSNGAAVSNVWITAEAQTAASSPAALANKLVEHHAVSDQSGQFSLLDLCQAAYRIRATDIRGRQAALAAEVPSDVSMKLQLERMGWLEALVEIHGKPVNDFTMALSGPVQQRLTAHASAKGFRTELPAGKYEILFVANSGYSFVSIVLASNTIQPMSVNLRPWSSLHGVLVFQDNTPAAGIDVTLSLLQLAGQWQGDIGLSPSLWPVHATTGSDGSFGFDHLVGRGSRLSFKNSSGELTLSNVKMPKSVGELDAYSRRLEIEPWSEENRDLGTIEVTTATPRNLHK